jgi:hypothetical protein
MRIPEVSVFADSLFFNRYAKSRASWNFDHTVENFKRCFQQIKCPLRTSARLPSSTRSTE